MENLLEIWNSSSSSSSSLFIHFSVSVCEAASRFSPQILDLSTFEMKFAPVFVFVLLIWSKVTFGVIFISPHLNTNHCVSSESRQNPVKTFQRLQTLTFDLVRWSSGVSGCFWHWTESLLGRRRSFPLGKNLNLTDQWQFRDDLWPLRGCWATVASLWSLLSWFEAQR